MAHEIDISSIPGTSHLVDVDHSLQANLERKDGIVYIPTPSDDPNDPLNWSRGRKWMQVFCICVFCFGGGVPLCCVYSILTDIAADPSIDITVAQLNEGTGYCFLFLGIGNIFLMPLALQYGKRPVYIISMLGSTLFTLWQPNVKSNPHWVASKILTGLFYAPIEALCEVSIADVFFEHQRGTYMGIYALALCSSNYMAPIFSGLIKDAIGWRWSIYIACVFGGCCTVFLFFFMEETNYNRKLKVTRDANGNILEVITSINHVSKEDSTEEKDQSQIHVVTSTGTVPDTIRNQGAALEDDESAMVEHAPARTFWQRFSFTHGVQKENHLVDYFIAPLYMAQFPVVLWAGFLYGSSLFWYTVLNATEATILGAEPYNFSSSNCGLAYFSPTIFCFIIYPLAGRSVDWLKIYFARKHGGRSEAEDRLWVLAFYAILGAGSLILWGVGASKGVHWFGPVFGMGLLAGLGLVGVVSSVTYALDTYEHMNYGCMTVIILIRNCMNFGMGYAITPFVENMGVQNCFIVCCFLCFACLGSFIIPVFCGKWIRVKQKDMYWRIVERYKKRGVIS